MDGWMDGRTDGRMDGRTDERTNERFEVTNLLMSCSMAIIYNVRDPFYVRTYRMHAKSSIRPTLTLAKLALLWLIWRNLLFFLLEDK